MPTIERSDWPGIFFDGHMPNRTGWTGGDKIVRADEDWGGPGRAVGEVAVELTLLVLLRDYIL
jgi:hypothetical protein